MPKTRKMLSDWDAPYIQSLVKQIETQSAEAGRPIRKTLRPCVEESKNWAENLKLDDTNMKDVYYTAGEYNQNLLTQMEDNIKEDRTDMDLLYACLLDWGLPLSMPHIQEKIDGFTVHTYNSGDLIACFDKHISDAAVKEIARRQPLRAVFRDSSFASSPAKINEEEIFKLLAPNTSVRVI